MSDETAGDAVVDASETSEVADEASTSESAEAEPSTATEAPVADLSEDAVVALIAERDEYLEALQRLKAEFANARRRDQERAVEQRSQAAAELVEKLLPVLDSCDAAVSQNIEGVALVRDALFDALAGQGLERIEPVGEAFDPEEHEAVMYEEGDGSGTQTVSELLRTGYRWNARVLRAPMVKVQG